MWSYQKGQVGTYRCIIMVGGVLTSGRFVSLFTKKTSKPK